MFSVFLSYLVNLTRGFNLAQVCDPIIAEYIFWPMSDDKELNSASLTLVIFFWSEAFFSRKKCAKVNYFLKAKQTVPCSSNLLVLALQRLQPRRCCKNDPRLLLHQRTKERMLRYSKSRRIAVVNWDGVSVARVANKSRAYDINLGLSDKGKNGGLPRWIDEPYPTAKQWQKE